MSNTEHYFVIKGTAVHQDKLLDELVTVKFEIDHEMTGLKFGNTPVYDVTNEKWVSNDNFPDDDIIMANLADMVDEFIGIQWKGKNSAKLV